MSLKQKIKLKTKPDVSECMMFMLVSKQVEELPVGYSMYDFQANRMSYNVFHIKSSSELFENFILPLNRTQIKQYSDRLEVRLFNVSDLVSKHIKKRKDYLRGALCFTTDPRVEHCADWSDLGMFRMLYKFHKPKIVSEGKDLLILIELKDGQPSIGKDFFLADREI